MVLSVGGSMDIYWNYWMYYEMFSFFFWHWCSFYNIFIINRKQKLKATSSFIESMEKDLDENDELKDEDR